MLLGLVASIPLVVGAVVDAVHGWLPYSDDATIVLRSRDVFSMHMPLVGQYSQLSEYVGRSVFDLGPMVYWVLAVPAQFTRWFPAATLLWMALVQSLVVVAIVCLANRVGGKVLAVASAIGVVAAALWSGPRLLYDPWNAYSAILPLVLLFFLTAAILAGHHRLLPFVVLVASYEVQAQPTYVMVAGLLSAVAVVAWLVDRRRARSMNWSVAAITVGVGVVCWLPTLVQQFTTSPGNLTLLWRATRLQGSRRGAAFGLTILGKAVAAGLAVPAGVAIRPMPSNPVSVPWAIGGLVTLLLFIFLLVSAIRRATREAVAIAGTGLALCIAVIATGVTPDDQNARTAFWLLTWTVPAASMVLWVTAVWTVWRLWGQRVLARHLVLSGTAILAFAALVTGSLGLRPDAQQWSYSAVRRSAAAIERLPGHGPYAIDTNWRPIIALNVGQGLTQLLDAQGYRVGANNGWETHLGRHYRVPSNATEILITYDPPTPGAGSTSASTQPLVTVPVIGQRGRRVVIQISVRRHRATPASARGSAGGRRRVVGD